MTAMHEPALSCENVSHVYQKNDELGNRALTNVDLAIKKGEFVAVLGHNGSGKSTLAKHFNALLQPTGGVVLVKGIDTRDGKRVWEVHQAAGMVFQNPDNQIVATVVEEDVAFGPENLGLEPQRIRRRVDDALERVGLKGFARKEPHMLSGGQKQRVAIAGILAMRPEIVILDEATAMLDPVGRREVLNIVKGLNADFGITIVYITHFMEEALHASRVLVMNRGRIVMDGPPRGIFTDGARLRAYGLDVPQMVELRMRLDEAGIRLPPSILTVEEMARALCRYISTT